MKLTSNLIRDTLICIEDKLNIDSDLLSLDISSVFWKDIFEDRSLCSKYDIDDIKYCIYKLYEEDFITAEVRTGGGKIHFIDIYDITWKGYDLLNNIKDDSVWEYVSKTVKYSSKMSISVLSELAKTALISFGKSQLF